VKTVLIGSGDAGLECAKNLCGEVLWISKNNYMTKKWLMSSMVAGYSKKKKEKIIIDIPRYIEKNNMNINFVVDEVINIDTEKKEVLCSKESYIYDKLIIATGSVPKMPRVEILDKEKVTTFDTYPDFVSAAEKLKSAKKVSVIGAGPIGFELSLRLSFKYDVSLVEYDHDILMQLLTNYPLYRYMVKKMIELMGIKLHLSTNACSVREDYVFCKTLNEDEFFVDSDVVIFAAGVRQNVPVIDGEDFHKDRVLFCDDFGKAFVHERGCIRKRLKDVYAIGDATCYLTKKNYPASAIFAEKSARVVAFNVMNGDKERIVFRPSIYYKFIDMILRRIIS